MYWLNHCVVAAYLIGGSDKTSDWLLCLFILCDMSVFNSQCSMFRLKH